MSSTDFEELVKSFGGEIIGIFIDNRTELDCECKRDHAINLLSNGSQTRNHLCDVCEKIDGNIES